MTTEPTNKFVRTYIRLLETLRSLGFEAESVRIRSKTKPHPSLSFSLDPHIVDFEILWEGPFPTEHELRSGIEWWNYHETQETSWDDVPIRTLGNKPIKAALQESGIPIPNEKWN